MPPGAFAFEDRRQEVGREYRRAFCIAVGYNRNPTPGGVLSTFDLGCHGQLVCPCSALADKQPVASNLRFQVWQIHWLVTHHNTHAPVGDEKTPAIFGSVALCRRVPTLLGPDGVPAMKSRKFVSFVVLGLLAIGCVASLPLGASAAEVAMKTQSWKNNDQAFEEFAKTIQERNPRNLLARRDVAFWVDGRPQRGYPFLGLADGQAGARGGEGRVFIGGKPTVIAFCLGQPKPVTEVGLYTFNVDMRANQDFEVRFANNATNPGQKPSFSSQPGAQQRRHGDRSQPRRVPYATGPPTTANRWSKVWSIGSSSASGRLIRLRRARRPTATNRLARRATSSWRCLAKRTMPFIPTAEELAHRELVRNAPKRPEFVERAHVVRDRGGQSRNHPPLGNTARQAGHVRLARATGALVRVGTVAA